MPACFERPAPPSRTAQRLGLLSATLEAWLASCGSSSAQREIVLRAVTPALVAWLDAPGQARPGDFLAAFSDLVAGHPELTPWQAPDTRTKLAAALARAVLAQATAEIETEAARAGHHDVFRALLPWLGRPMPVDAAQRLAAERGLGAAALDRALVRLRRRWRQRIDAGLALCSDKGVHRDELRARLHAALVHGESQP